MSEIAPRWAQNITQPAMEVFVGIPSVVYGWLGHRRSSCRSCATNFRGLGFTLGFSWFAGSLVLALMILPTITAIAYDVVRRDPAGPADRVAGARDRRAGRRSATSSSRPPRPGLLTAVVLGMMRAAGEALAVQMVIGNRPIDADER